MRSFIAVDLDPPLCKALSRAQARLRTIAPKLKYVDPDSMHLTLKFLGEIDPRSVPEISAKLDEVASRAAPMEFTIRDLGVFADRGDRVRVVWAGIDDTDGSLAALQKSVEAAMDAIGYPPEGRPFSPHLTLARARRPVSISQLSAFVENEGSVRFGSQCVESITLYESRLTREGPIYSALSRHEFGDT